MLKALQPNLNEDKGRSTMQGWEGAGSSAEAMQTVNVEDLKKQNQGHMACREGKSGWPGAGSSGSQGDTDVHRRGWNRKSPVDHCSPCSTMMIRIHSFFS